MTRIRSLPFREASPDRVEVVAWSRIEGGEVSPMPDRCDDWDQQTALHLQVDAICDVAGIVEDCGLRADGPVRVQLVWHSPATSIRGRGSALDLRARETATQVSLDAVVPGTDVADRVRATLLVTAPRVALNDSSVLSPRQAGSALWSESRELQLEGVAGRFPMEWADFRDSPTLPDNAAWFLSWDPGELTEPFRSSVRLYLNESHARAQPVLGGYAPEVERRYFHEVAFFDIGRALIRGVLRNDEFLGRDASFPDESVGSVLQDLIDASFASYSPRDLRRMLDDEPDRFDSVLQDRLRFLTRY